MRYSPDGDSKAVDAERAHIVEVSDDLVLAMQDVSLTLGGTSVLRGIDLSVRAGEHWAILGPNGAGKSSMLKLAGLQLRPSAGIVDVLGRRVGRTDIRALRAHVGYMSAALADTVRPRALAQDVVMTAKYGALEPWWHTYDDADRQRALDLLGMVEMGTFADHTFESLSSGERQRVLLARTLMTDPPLVLLDEPTASLDLAGREELLSSLAELYSRAAAPATMLVTHHVEEIPVGTSHVILLKEGAVLAAGTIDDVLSSDSLSECFGLAVSLRHHRGRWSVTAG